jgi:hypothetical protein
MERNGQKTAIYKGHTGLLSQVGRRMNNKRVDVFRDPTFFSRGKQNSVEKWIKRVLFRAFICFSHRWEI